MTKTVAWAILSAAVAPVTLGGSIALGAGIAFADSSMQEIVKATNNQSEGFKAAGEQIIKSSLLGAIGGGLGTTSKAITINKNAALKIGKDAAFGAGVSLAVDAIGGESGIPQELKSIDCDNSKDFKVLAYMAVAEGDISFDEKKKKFYVSKDGNYPRKQELVDKLNGYLD